MDAGSTTGNPQGRSTTENSQPSAQRVCFHL